MSESVVRSDATAVIVIWLLILYIIKMSSYKVTKNAFLWGMAAIYLLAFSSLYVQIPGNYPFITLIQILTFITIKGFPIAIHK